MNFEEQISSFIDGALSTEAESELLHILSVSPEKIALLHDHLRLRTMFASDSRASAVPSQLDAAILGSAGLTIAGASAAAQTAVGAAASGFSWTLGRLLSVGVIGLSLFGAGFYFATILPSDEVSNKASEIVEHSASTDQHVDESTIVFEGIESSESDAHHSDQQRLAEASTSGGTSAGHMAHRSDPPGTHGTSASRIVYRNVYITQTDTLFVPSSFAFFDNEHDSQIPIPAAVQYIPSAERSITIIQAPGTVMKTTRPGRFDIEIQRDHIDTWPYIDYSRFGVERARRHVSLFASYAFDSRHAIGAMLGEQSFAMEYYRLENDSLYIYQQQPTLLYGGAFYRLSIPIARGMVPEFMLQAGGTDVGPMLGTRLALRLTPIDRISVILGANGTMLAYRYKDKLFTSHSLGFSYGIRYQF